MNTCCLCGPVGDWPLRQGPVCFHQPRKTHKTFTAARWLTFTVNEAQSVSGIGNVWPNITPPHNESEMDMEPLLAAFAPNCAELRDNKSYGEKNKIYNLNIVSDLPREECWKVFSAHSSTGK